MLKVGETEVHFPRPYSFLSAPKGCPRPLSVSPSGAKRAQLQRSLATCRPLPPSGERLAGANKDTIFRKLP